MFAIARRRRILNENGGTGKMMSTTAETPKAPAQTALSQLDQLKQFTVVVADSGDFAALKLERFIAATIK
jgi:hypothetical protein